MSVYSLELKLYCSLKGYNLPYCAIIFYLCISGKQMAFK